MKHFARIRGALSTALAGLGEVLSVAAYVVRAEEGEIAETEENTPDSQSSVPAAQLSEKAQRMVAEGLEMQRKAITPPRPARVLKGSLQDRTNRGDL